MLLLSLLAAMAASGGWEEVKKCSSIVDEAGRLACYDDAVGRSEAKPIGTPLPPLENKNTRGQYDPGLLRQAVEMIRDHGWRCDTLTSMTVPHPSEYRFTVTCNQFRYTYRFEDRGGQWRVSVE